MTTASVTPGAVIRAVSSSYGQAAISTAVGLLLTPLYLKYLGTEVFGLWATVLSVAAYLNVGGLGLPQAAGNLMAEAAARGERRQFGDLFATTLWTAVGLALAGSLLLLILIGAGMVGSRVFGRGAETAGLAGLLVAIVGAGMMLNLPLEQARIALRAWQRVDLEQGLISVGRIASLALTAVAFWLGGDVIAVAIIYAATLVLPGLLAWMLGTIRLKLPLRLTGARRQYVGALLRPSAHFFLLMMAGALVWGTDNVVLALTLGPTAVTPYAVAMRMFMVASGLLTMGLGALTPTVAGLWGQQDKPRLQRLFIVVLRLGVATAALLSVELGVFGRDFMVLWTGGRAEVSPSVFWILWGVFLLRMVGSSFEIMLLGTSQHRTYARVALAEGLLNLALSLVLVRFLGAAGVALGTLCALGAATGWYVPWRSMQLAELRWHKLGRDVLRPILVPCAAALTLAIAARNVLPAIDWGSWVISAGATAGAFLSLYVWRGATDAEKVLIRGLLRRKRGRTTTP